MSTKVANYQNEKFNIMPTASYNRGTPMTVEIMNGVMFIDYAGVVAGLPPKGSWLYLGDGFKYAVKPTRTVGDLSANQEQYGFVGVSMAANGGILINASNAPASPVELRFTLVTPIQY